MNFIVGYISIVVNPFVRNSLSIYNLTVIRCYWVNSSISICVILVALFATQSISERGLSLNPVTKTVLQFFTFTPTDKIHKN